jgi:hypothetical protein
MDQATQAQKAAPQVEAVAEQPQSVLGNDNPVVSTEATKAVSNTETVASDNTDFINSLGEDYKVIAHQKGFKNTDDVLKSYTNLESMMGKKFDELTNEELKGVYTKLGAPETPEGYEFEAAQMPEGVEDTMTEWFSSKAHELGISKDAAQHLRNEFIAKQAEEYGTLNIQAQTKATDDLATLKQEFGSAFNERVNLAATALNEFGGDGVKEVINKYGLNNNPALVKMFAELGKLTSEGKMSTDKNATPVQFGITPVEAGAKIAEKFADKAFMARFYSQTDPGHNDAVREIEQLYKLKNSVKG